MGRPSTIRAYLQKHPESRALLDHLRSVIKEIGPVGERTTRSQVAFRRVRTVALAWAPGQYLGGRGAPLVLTLHFPDRVPSPRWKEVVEPKPGVFAHHLELRGPSDLDDEVRAWLKRAFDAAG